MEFNSFQCRICNGKLVPGLNEVRCSNCNFIEHPVKETNFKINTDELKRKISSREDFLVLDVREKWEHSLVNISGSVLIPMRELKDKINSLDKNKLIITLCHRGVRASYAARYLLQNGFKNAKYLEGGIDAWANKIDNSLRRY
ncbi:rhodanese-like domain-containing protein [Candidatus Woesearchaeota archaeon]|nr:rhodanese-like domain-containing protein [Candidatus Woesearchaeota archaeon]